MADLFEASVRIKPTINPADTTAEIEKGVVSPLKASAATIASVIGTIGLAKVFKGGLDELKEQQEVLTQTTALLKANAGAAGVSAQAINDFAEAEQKKTGKDKEAIQAGENLLLQFRNVKNQAGENNDIFTQASKIAIDLSVATGRDLTSSYQTLGKALQDPEQGSRALRAANVILTQSQKDQIKAMEDSGNTIGAQKYLLQQLQGQIGGVADAYGQTLPGRLERAKNELDDVKARIVSGLTPALEFAASAADKFGQVSESLPAPLQTVAAALVATAVVARPVSLVFSGLTSIFGAVSSGMSSLVSRIAAFDGSLGQLALSGGLAAAAIGGITFAVVQYLHGQQEAQQAADEFTQAIKKQTGALDENVDAVAAKQLGDSVAGRYLREAGANADVFTKAVRENRDSISQLQRVADTGQGSIRVFKDQMDNGTIATTSLTTELRRLVDSGKLTADQFDVILRSLGNVEGAYQTGNEKAKDNAFFTGQAGDAAKTAAGAQDDLAGSTDETVVKATELTEAQKRQVAQMQAVIDHAKEQTDALNNLADAQQGLLGQNLSYEDATRGVTQAQRDLDQVQRSHAQAVRDSQKAQADYNTVLKDPKASPIDRANALAQLQDAQRRASPQQLADDEATARSRLEKAIDDQAKSYADLQAKQAAANGQTFDATQKLGAYKDELDKLIDQHPQIAADLDDLKHKIDVLPDKKTITLDVYGNVATSPFPADFGKQLQQDIRNTFNPFKNFGQGATQGYRDPNTGGRASGGPVNAGALYRFGEQGPEVFSTGGRNYMLPGENGQVTASNHLGGNNIVINVSNPDPQSAAREITHSLLAAVPGLHGRQAA